MAGRRPVSSTEATVGPGIEAKRALAARLLASRDRDRSYRASIGQEQVWFAQQLDPSSGTYNVAMAIEMEGALDFSKLEECLRAVADRHEVLRTRFELCGDELHQVADPDLVPDVWVIDLRSLSRRHREPVARALVGCEAGRPFDLERGPPLRLYSVRLEDERQVVLVVVHHIVCDAWSIGALLEELSVLYRFGLCRGRELLPPLSIQYGDFAHWQRKQLQGPRAAQAREYWGRELRDAPELDLPTDRVRSGVVSFAGSTHEIEFPAAGIQRLLALCREEEATPFVGLLTTVAAFLARHARQDELVVGAPFAGRTRPELQPLIGFFVNPLPIRIRFARESTLRELIRGVRGTVLDALAHQELPLDQIVEVTRCEHEGEHRAAFRAAFLLQDHEDRLGEFPGLRGRPWELSSGGSRFDLSFAVLRFGDSATCRIEYSSELFDHGTVVQLGSRLREFLGRISEAPDDPIATAALPTLREQQLLREVNDTAADDNGARTDHAVAARASEEADRVAVEHDGASLTYGELERRANQLGRYLHRLGVRRESRVAVRMEPSLELVVALLGVMKAGGAFVPIDPRIPRERALFIIRDAAAQVLVGDSGLGRGVSVERGIDLRTDWEMVARESDESFDGGASGENLAYVIYTSGSTGQAKGILIEHGGFCDRMHAFARTLALGPGSRVLQFASLSADPSIYEIFTALVSGATVCLTDRETLLDPTALAAVLQNRAISALTLPPSMLALLPAHAEFPALRVIVSTGEECHAGAARQWSRGRRFLNGYGPSEVTVGATVAELAGAHAIPTIGRPVANVQVYVVDDNLENLPPGVPGEICIAGVGLARGYLERPGMTAERFVPNPFSGTPGARMYRTGDRGRWLPEGQLEFLGREDRQVKVRGWRVEPSEVEAALRGHADVQDAAVDPRRDPRGDLALVAFIATSRRDAAFTRELRDFLEHRLPPSMVPARFEVLDGLPRTSNGKIDRRALPRPEWKRRADGSRPAEWRTPAEEIVAGIWREVLGVGEIAADADFFHLGGNSLRCAQIVARVRDTLGVDLPVRLVFERRTIAGIAAFVDAARAPLACQDAALERDPSRRVVPLSLPQESMWALLEGDPDPETLLMGARLRVRGLLDPAALERAVAALVARHDALRTRFVRDGETMLQRFDSPWPESVPCVDLGDIGIERAERTALDLSMAAARRAFDLEEGPPLRFALLRLGPDDHVLLVDIHHLVCDAWSVSLMQFELAAFYSAALDDEEMRLPEPEVQYADFTVWQRERVRGPHMESINEFWRSQLDGLRPSRLPPDLDGSGPSRNAYVPLEIPTPLARAALDLSGCEAASLYMVLVTAYEVLIRGLTGRDEISLCSPVANRARREVERTVGFMAHPLMLRTNLAGNPSFREALRRVRDAVLDAYAHQDLPLPGLTEMLGESVEEFLHQRLRFALHPMAIEATAPLGWEVSSFGPPVGRGIVELGLDLWELPGGVLRGELTYDATRFSPATAAHWRSSFLRILADAVRDPETPIRELFCPSIHGAPPSREAAAPEPASTFDKAGGSSGVLTGKAVEEGTAGPRGR